MFTINVQTFSVSEGSGGPYYNCFIKKGTKTYAANLIFIW